LQPNASPVEQRVVAYVSGLFVLQDLSRTRTRTRTRTGTRIMTRTRTRTRTGTGTGTETKTRTRTRTRTRTGTGTVTRIRTRTRTKTRTRIGTGTRIRTGTNPYAIPKRIPYRRWVCLFGGDFGIDPDGGSIRTGSKSPRRATRYLRTPGGRLRAHSIPVGDWR